MNNSCKDYLDEQQQSDLVIDPLQKYKITLKIEGKTDRTAKVYKFICAIFRLDKTSLHQGLAFLAPNQD